jgi:hypothetical protein
VRQSGEQWVEVIDEKKHMVKEVKSDNEHVVCPRCMFSDGHGTCVYPEDDCPVRNGHYIKDLGILNEDGCLPSPWGGYPKIVRVGREGFCTYKVRFYLNHEGVYGSTLVEVTGNTRQEAIDAWNRRA